MAKMYYDEDANLEKLKGKKIAVLGYGSQGHAQAMNLKDTGMDVIVGLRKGSKSWGKAEHYGLKVVETEQAAQEAEIIQILIPDDSQPAVYENQIKPHLEPSNTLVFSHGFNVQYSQVVPPEDVDVFMVAPKSPGHRLRETFTEGHGVPGLLAVYQDYTGETMDKALAYAKGIGCTRAGVIETSFQEETETDLFGEQSVLCGGVTELVKAGFDTLVEEGYQPEIAYFECLHELKLIVDLMYQGGLSYMRYSVSDTAEFGDYTRGKRVITDETREEMRKILREVQDGSFAKEWILENQAHRAHFNARASKEREHQIEEVGAKLRQMISWLPKNS